MLNEMDQDILDEIVRRLVTFYKPVTIYLFGSYAWGVPTKYSDLDICVILDNSSQKQVDRIRAGVEQLKGIHFPVDILVFTMKEIEARRYHPSTLIGKVFRKGIKLYEAA